MSFRWKLTADDPSLLSTFATGGQVRSQVDTDGTDQTATLQAEIDALMAAGGGTLLLPEGTITLDGTITLVNDAATPPKQAVLRIVGQGCHWSGRGTAPVGGTTLDIAGTDTYGKIKTNGLGLLAITGVTFRDTSGDDTPFIYTTNTTLHIRECAFFGSKTGVSCDQDGIILGGPDQIEGGGAWTDGFQGYGTIIEDCFYSGIRRGVVGQAFANAIKISRLTAWTTCGNTAGGFIEWDGKPTGIGVQAAAGCTITDCLIEMPNTQYGIILRNALGFDLRGNSFFDYDEVKSVAGILLDTTALGNRVTNGASVDGAKPAVIDTTGRNTVSAMEEGIPSTWGTGRQVYTAGLASTSSDGRGAIGMNSAGHGSGIRTVFTSSHTGARVTTVPAVSVTDGVITDGSRTLTSATAAFVVGDIGTAIGATGLQSGTRIGAVLSATEVILTKTATATATGVTVTIGRPAGTAIEQVHFGRQHWQALGTAPTPAAGAGAGSGATVALSGVDVAGKLSVTTGTSAAPGVLGSWTPAINYSGAARVQLCARNAATAALLAGGYWISGTTGAQSVNVVGTPADATLYEIDYLVIES